MNVNRLPGAFKVLVCLSAAAMLLFAFLDEAAAQEDFTVYYRVKFVCGESEGRIVSRGNFFTAINVHNPQGPLTKPVKLRKMFTIALPSERAGGHTEFPADVVELGPADAMEIDCADILRRTQELCPAGFCKGFVVIESPVELEVVAVYTAADLNTGQVTTLHTERISPDCRTVSRNVPEQTLQTLLFVPPDIGGEDADPDFHGHGPCIVFRLTIELEDQDRTLAAKYRMHAYECSDDYEKPKHDYTSAAGSNELVLMVASPHERILGHNRSTGMLQRYIDEDHADDIFTYPVPNPVEKLRFVGDTKGDEAGIKTGVFITLRPMTVMVETCTPQASKPVID